MTAAAAVLIEAVLRAEKDVVLMSKIKASIS